MLKVSSPYSPVPLVTVVLTTLRHPSLSSNDDCAWMWVVERVNKSAMMTVPVLHSCLFDLLMLVVAIILGTTCRYIFSRCPDNSQSVGLARMATSGVLARYGRGRCLSPRFLHRHRMPDNTVLLVDQPQTNCPKS